MSVLSKEFACDKKNEGYSWHNTNKRNPDRLEKCLVGIMEFNITNSFTGLIWVCRFNIGWKNIFRSHKISPFIPKQNFTYVIPGRCSSNYSLKSPIRELCLFVYLFFRFSHNNLLLYSTSPSLLEQKMFWENKTLLLYFKCLMSTLLLYSQWTGRKVHSLNYIFL